MQEGIVAYQGSVKGKLIRCLQEIYPVCERLVGEPFFAAMASRYASEHASTSPDLGDCGAGTARNLPARSLFHARSPPLSTFVLKNVHNGEMPSKPPVVFPQEQRLLSQLGERLRLARLRRKLSNAVVAQRAGISRTSLYKVEAGDPGATLGTYLRVMAVLGLEADFNALAADDKVGRRLQDLVFKPPASQARRRQASADAPKAPSGRANGTENSP